MTAFLNVGRGWEHAQITVFEPRASDEIGPSAGRLHQHTYLQAPVCLKIAEQLTFCSISAFIRTISE